MITYHALDAARWLNERACALALVLLVACTPVKPPYGPRSESGETAQLTTVAEVKDLLAQSSIACDQADEQPFSRFASDSAACREDAETRYFVYVFDDEGQTRNWLREVSTQRGTGNGLCYLLGPRWSLQMAAQRNKFQDALGGTWAEHRSGGCG